MNMIIINNILYLKYTILESNKNNYSDDDSDTSKTSHRVSLYNNLVVTLKLLTGCHFSICFFFI